MHPGALRALEFDRIVSVVAGLALTPTGRRRLSALQPMAGVRDVIAAQRATSEGRRFLDANHGFPLRAPSTLEAILDSLAVSGRALEPQPLLDLADYLDSIAAARAGVERVAAAFPILRAVVDPAATFAGEIAAIRRAIEPGGAVSDHASPALAAIRGRLRTSRQRLRSTLDRILKGRESSKYLQEPVVSDRNGRYVLMVRAEHRSSIPGILHGTSASGASLFVEPMDTVEINNDIVELEEEEAEEVRRILLALSDAFRDRAAELADTLEVGTSLDTIQARARCSTMLDAVEPVIASDGTFELRGARHPLLVLQNETGFDFSKKEKSNPVSPVDILLTPPTRVLVIAGPNTGGKTVALKTAGLLAAMAQAGLHIPVNPGSRLPVFQSLFADIGDEQSIAESLSTFSAHIANVVAMDRDLALPGLVLLDEVGAGTDPVEGGALGIAIIDHFRARGAHLVATTHYDSLKSYASTTDGVVGAAFGFDPDTFAPTYRLTYGSPGRSLAIEIAARLGLPEGVIARARANLSDPERQLAEHLARVDADLRALEDARHALALDRRAVTESEDRLRAREESVRERERTFRRRLDARLDDQVRDARRRIDEIIEGLKAKAAAMTERASLRLTSPTGAARVAGLNTGELGEARADARSLVDQVVGRARTELPGETPQAAAPETTIGPGTRVVVGTIGLEGEVIAMQGGQAEIDVRGKRLRAWIGDLRVIGGPPPTAPVRVSVDLQPRTGSTSELNVVGLRVEEAIERIEKFIDQSVVSDERALRIVHGHGTGRLRRGLTSFLKDHPLVARLSQAPQEQGGSGVTVVELKE
jgi:DNA mismatch repair protein MutS2